MNENHPLDTGILLIILGLCLFFILRHIRNLFSSTPDAKSGCHGCSKRSSACKPPSDPTDCSP